MDGSLTLDAISIHALRVEGDLRKMRKEVSQSAFLSTPSGWRATLTDGIGRMLDFLISIHALRVEGDLHRFQPRSRFLISIHALRVEGDGGGLAIDVLALPISIHALRVEGDPGGLLHT